MKKLTTRSVNMNPLTFTMVVTFLSNLHTGYGGLPDICESDKKCPGGMGDCDSDSHCQGVLECDSNNCDYIWSDASSSDDCCIHEYDKIENKKCEETGSKLSSHSRTEAKIKCSTDVNCAGLYRPGCSGSKYYKCEDQGTSSSFKSSSSSCVYKKELGSSCSSDKYKCQNGNCIDKDYECDGLFDDCGDGSDEHSGCEICFDMQVLEDGQATSWTLTGRDTDVVGSSGASLNAKGQSCDSSDVGEGKKGCCFEKCGEFRLRYRDSGGNIEARMHYYAINWASAWINLPSTYGRDTYSDFDVLIDFNGCFEDRNRRRSVEKRFADCNAFTSAAV